MRYRNRSGFFKVVTTLFVIALAVMAVVTVWAVATETARDDAVRIRNAGQYADNAQDRINRDCLHLEPTAIAKCIQQIIEATREDERDEHDLFAQRGMERWAFWMVIISLAGLGVTSVGVVYVALTLREARNTTRAAVDSATEARKAVRHAAEANSIMREDQRPWVTIDREVPCDFMADEGTAVCHWKYKLVNHGKLPAQSTRVKQKIIRCSRYLEMAKFYRKFVVECKEDAGSLGGQIIFPGQTERAHEVESMFASKLETAGHGFALMACVTYATYGGIGIDCQLFEIGSIEQFPVGPRVNELIAHGDLRIVE